MKSEIVKKDKINAEYPCLKAWGDLIILFTKPNTGTIVHVHNINSAGCYVGEYTNTWSEELYKPFGGQVILSND